MPCPSATASGKATCLALINALPPHDIVIAYASREEVAAGGLDVNEVRPSDLDVGKIES
jgi:hypothetical protein